MAPVPAHHPLVGSDPAWVAVRRRVSIIAGYDRPVLVLGETGTGKTTLAEVIHASSRRAHGPLVVLDCATIARDVVESELFGHVRGAFSGALRDHAGAFERADGGTLFLDEIGELPLDLQQKLLRAVESGCFRRVGGEKDIKVDVRIIAATHRDLPAMVREGSFRADLFFRLAKLTVEMPPLAARPADVVALAEQELARANVERADLERPPARLTASALEALAAHDWSRGAAVEGVAGNIRDVQILVWQGLVEAELEQPGAPVVEIYPRHIGLPDVATGRRPTAATDVRRPNAATEARHMDDTARAILDALRSAPDGLSWQELAERAGLRRAALYERINTLVEGVDYRKVRQGKRVVYLAAVGAASWTT